ncbi:MAG: hypothetical protein Fur0037_23970 [Planctomycetota bacterium]
MDDGADARILEHARGRGALILTNDRFRDRPRERQGVLTLQFSWGVEGLLPFPEATWFRSPGTALRVPLGALARKAGGCPISTGDDLQGNPKE